MEENFCYSQNMADGEFLGPKVNTVAFFDIFLLSFSRLFGFLRKIHTLLNSKNSDK